MVKFLRSSFFSGVVTLFVLLGFSFSGLGVLQLEAAPFTDVIISEYIEGSSNNKALEFYNGTGATINLATDNYVLQMYSNGAVSAGLTISLTGTIANGGVYILANSGANATILAVANQTNGAGWFNGNDAVVLRKGGAGGTVVDSIGQIGNNPGTEWGTGLQSTADNTLRRMSTICAGDTDPSNVYTVTEWDGFATDTFGGLGSHTEVCTGDAPPRVASTVPVDNATNVATSLVITVNFNESVTVSTGWYTVVCNSVDVTSSFTQGGSGASYTLTYGGAPFAGSEPCIVTLTSGNITDLPLVQPLDGNNDGTGGDNYSFDFTLAPPPTVLRIHDIQGNGATSPLVGSSVEFTGIVIGEYLAANELEGFFVQEEDADVDADPLTSEGIFVFCGGGGTCLPVNIGDEVTVTGAVVEFFGQTQVDNGNSNLFVVVNGTGAVPTVTNINIGSDIVGAGADKDSFYEAFEGMYVNILDTMSIAEYFEHFRFGELVLYQGGRPYQYTHNDDTPTAGEYSAFLTDLSRRRIVLDDGSDVQNRPLNIVPQQLFYPYPSGLSTTNAFRGGDTIAGLRGVLGYGFSEWRLQPTEASYSFTSVNPRPAAPSVGGNVVVASFNVLNYFTTIDTTLSNDVGTCGPVAGTDCRGADSAAELTLQTDKLVQALAQIDADVFGLVEIENNGTTVASLVSSLNAVVGAGTYDYINTGVVGTDAITVAIIYKAAVLQPVGTFLVDNDAVHNRPPLAQTFEVIDAANPDFGGVFTVIVNHFKSKGSACGAGDDDTTTGQGNCNITRIAQATRLLSWIGSDVLPAAADDDVLIIGDLNSNRGEDPIDTLLAGGYTNLVDAFIGINAYSYVFDGQLGYLDHALGSTTISPQVVGVADWHINADEPVEFDYNDTTRDAGEATFEEEPDANNLYEVNPYRTSDHDPVLIGLDLTENVLPPVVAQVRIQGLIGGVIRSRNVRVIQTLFDRAMLNVNPADPAWDDSVINPANYILYYAGVNGVIDTVVPANFCLAGPTPGGDDIQITLDGTVVYDPVVYGARLRIADAMAPLGEGDYLLVICGSTSVVDLTGVPIDGDTDTVAGGDFSFPFTVVFPALGGGTTGGGTGTSGGSTGTVVDGGIDYDGDGIPDVTQLPNTGESSLWSSWIVWAGILLLLASMSLLMIGSKQKKN